MLKGSLVATELFDRLSHMHLYPAGSKEALAKEKAVRKEAEKKITALETERSRDKAAWRRELDGRENLIKGYKLERTKQTASIEKLYGEVATLKEEINCLKQGINTQDGHIKSLAKEVEFERRHKGEDEEGARSAHQLAERLKHELAKEQSAHQASKAEAQDLEIKFAHLSSAKYWKKVVEEYRHSSLGKIEVALTCKAGIDHLASLLYPASLPASDRLYPPSVYNYLDLLKDIETAGGGEHCRPWMRGTTSMNQELNEGRPLVLLLLPLWTCMRISRVPLATPAERPESLYLLLFFF